MRVFMFIWLCLCFSWSLHSQEQEYTPPPTKEPFWALKEGVPVQERQGIKNTYQTIPILYPHTNYGVTFIWNKKNKYSIYASAYEYTQIAMWWRVSDAPRLLRLMRKHLYPYLGEPLRGKDKHAGSLTYTLYPKLDYKVSEVMLSYNSDFGRISVPAKVFERLEAETMQSGLRVMFPNNKRYLFGHDWITAHFPLDLSHLQGYDKSKERTFYDNLDTLRLYQSRDLDADVKRAVRYMVLRGYDQGWDTDTFKFFTPEVIGRVIIKSGTRSYYRNGSTRELRKDGDDAFVLLPFETERAGSVNEKEDYHIILQYPHGWKPIDYATHIATKLAQVYISYELMIEAYIDPAVKKHLEHNNWFEGNWGKTLDYYATLKGIKPMDLAQTYLREMSQYVSAALPYESIDLSLHVKLIDTLKGSECYDELSKPFKDFRRPLPGEEFFDESDPSQSSI